MAWRPGGEFQGEKLAEGDAISGRAEARQLPKCDLAYVNGNGGMMSEQVALILEGA